MFLSNPAAKGQKHQALLAYCRLRDADGLNARHVVAARNGVAESHRDLLYVVAHRYRCRSFSTEDLAGYGAIGLIRAIERFDPRRECALATPARWWIRAEIGRAVVELDSIVRVPTHVQQVRDEAVRDDVRRIRAAISLDSPQGEENSSTRGDELVDANGVDPETRLLEQEKRGVLVAALAELPEHMKRVIRIRLGNARDAEESVERACGMSYHRVRQVERVAVARLSEQLRRADLSAADIDELLASEVGFAAASTVHQKVDGRRRSGDQ